MLELPLVICDIQRAGPSTGMPTKPEQGDLLMVLFGRNGESPVPVVAARDAVRLLRRGDRGVPHRAQVPHARVPALGRVPRERLRAVAPARRRVAARHLDDRSRPSRTPATTFLPYLRDEETLARPWAMPGTPGLEHRIGGLEKADRTGNVSYDPDNHDLMTRLRAQKVAGHRRRHPGARGRRPRRGRDACSCSAGAARTGRSPPRAGACAQAGEQGRARAPAPPEPVPAQPRRRARARTTGCSCRR